MSAPRRIAVPVGWELGKTQDGSDIFWRDTARGIICVAVESWTAYESMLARQQYDRARKRETERERRFGY